MNPEELALFLEKLLNPHKSELSAQNAMIQLLAINAQSVGTSSLLSLDEKLIENNRLVELLINQQLIQSQLIEILIRIENLLQELNN